MGMHVLVMISCSRWSGAARGAIPALSEWEAFGEPSTVVDGDEDEEDDIARPPRDARVLR